MSVGTAVVNIPPCVEPTCFMPTPVTPPGPPVPVLLITKSHNGNFRSGLQGTYTITVCNQTGAGPTDGSPISVVDTLPSGLTGASMSGTGWTCDVGTLTATRSDILGPGVCFPPITLVVNVT